MLQAGNGQALGFSATYIALLIGLGVLLTIRVIAVRREKKVGLGDGGDRELLKRMRAHGNFSETAPLISFVLILLPLLGAGAWLVNAVGLAGLVGRILHAIGVSTTSGSSFGRVAGMLLTFASLLGGALALLVLAWR